MSKPSLWLVRLDDADWDYDDFVEAAVWAGTAEDAERIVRAEPRGDYGPWIEKPEWRLHVRAAPTEGVVLVHWHAG
jgi:hypothetical protein